MHTRTICCLALCAALVLAAPGLWGQSDAIARPAPSGKTLTMTIMGSLGPILSGSDPLGLDGQNGTVTVQASESLPPTKHTSNSATYTLPAGAITIKAGSHKFKTTTKSTMVVKLRNSADILTLNARGPEDLKITGIAYLQPDSWTKSVLKHPTTFSPSPQTLTAAENANGPGSKVKYTIDGSTTVLGLSGAISCSDDEDWLFYGEDR
jgi:hypothetical protein